MLFTLSAYSTVPLQESAGILRQVVWEGRELFTDKHTVDGRGSVAEGTYAGGHLHERDAERPYVRLTAVPFVRSRRRLLLQTVDVIFPVASHHFWTHINCGADDSRMTAIRATAQQCTQRNGIANRICTRQTLG